MTGKGCYVVEIIYRIDDYKHAGRDWERHECVLFTNKKSAYHFAIKKVLEYEFVRDKLKEIDGLADVSVSTVREHFNEYHTDENIFINVIKPIFKKGHFIMSPEEEILVYEEQIFEK